MVERNGMPWGGQVQSPKLAQRLAVRKQQVSGHLCPLMGTQLDTVRFLTNIVVEFIILPSRQVL